MITYIKDNYQFLLVCLLWAFVGVFSSAAAYALIALTILIFRKKNMYEYLLLGFFFILLLSDSLWPPLAFAKTFKNIYIVLLGIFFFLNIKEVAPFPKKVFIIFVPFFVFALFCLFFLETVVSIEKTVSYILLYLLVPCYVVLSYRKNGDAFLRNVVLFPVLLLIVGLVLIFVNRDIAFLNGSRFRGLLGSPNGVGLLSNIILMLFMVVNSMRDNLFTKNEKILCWCVIIICVLLSGSRNSVLAMVLLIVYSRFYKVSALLGFSILLLTLFIYFAVENNIEQIVRALGLSEYFRLNTLSEGSGRFVAWNFAWGQVQKATLFVGKGFGYDEYFMRPNYGLLARLGHQGGVHNSFLSLWLDVGLIGILLYLRSYGLMFIRAAKRNKLAYPIMFSLAFTAMFESWMVGSLNPFTIFLVIIGVLMLEGEFYESEEAPVPGDTEEPDTEVS